MDMNSNQKPQTAAMWAENVPLNFISLNFFFSYFDSSSLFILVQILFTLTVIFTGNRQEI